MDNTKIIPDNTNKNLNTNTNTNEINAFLQSLNDKQLKAFDIAKTQLGSSFDIHRCNGFINWKKSQTEN